MSSVELTRQALYDLVWREPMTAVAKRLGISDVALSKHCRKADIPTPPRGYWAAKAAGRAVRVVALPERGLGQSDEIVIGNRSSLDADPALEPIPPRPEFVEDVETLRARAAKLVGKGAFTRRLEPAHPVVMRLLEADQERAAKFVADPYDWNKPHFDTPPMQRRLRLFNALAFALARAGSRVLGVSDDAATLNVRVGNTTVTISIGATKPLRGMKSSKQAKSAGAYLELSAYEANPAGLTVRWEDSEDAKLESALRDVAINVMVLAELAHRGYVLWRHDWLVKCKREHDEQLTRQREAVAQRVREELRRREAERRERLLTQAANLRQAADIRALVAAMRARSDGAACVDALTQWAEWALAFAQAIDPTQAPMGAWLSEFGLESASHTDL